MARAVFALLLTAVSGLNLSIVLVQAFIHWTGSHILSATVMNEESGKTEIDLFKTWWKKREFVALRTGSRMRFKIGVGLFLAASVIQIFFAFGDLPIPWRVGFTAIAGILFSWFFASAWHASAQMESWLLENKLKVA